MTTLSYPSKPVPGDRIAVVSPGSGLPGLFPRPFELGLERLRKEYGLEPVEYPNEAVRDVLKRTYNVEPVGL